MKNIKKKYLVVFLIVIILIGAGTFTFSALRGPKIEVVPAQDLTESRFQNKVLERDDGQIAHETDPIEALFIAIGVFRNQPHFQAKTEGVNKANVLFKTVTQGIVGEKYYKDGEVFVENVSIGIKPVGRQMYVTENDYIVRKALSFSETEATEWEDEPTNYKEEDFLEMFGVKYFDFSQYIFNDESVLSATVLEKTENDITIKYELDPKISPEAYRHEVGTMGGAKRLPDFRCAQIVITMTKDFVVTKTVTTEEYEITVLGNILTSGEIVNTFTYDDIDIPHRDYYQAYFGNDVIEVVDDGYSAMDYLTQAVGPLIKDPRGINFSGTAIVNDYPIILSGSIALDPIDVRINIDNSLLLEYSSNKLSGESELYIQYDKFKGKVSDSLIKRLTGFDIADLLTGDEGKSKDMIAKLEENLSVKENVDYATVTLSLDQGKVTFQIDRESMKILSIAASIDVANQEILINAFLNDKKVDEIQNKEQFILIDDYIEDIEELIEKPQFEINIPEFEFDVEGIPIKAQVVALANINEGLKIDGSLTLKLNEETYRVNFQVIDEEIYISYGENLKLEIDFDEIKDLVETINGLFNLDLNIDGLQQYGQIKLDSELFNLLKLSKARITEQGIEVELMLDYSIQEPVYIRFKEKQLYIDLPAGIEANINPTYKLPRQIKPEEEFVGYPVIKDLLYNVQELISNKDFKLNIDSEIPVQGKDLSVNGKVYINLDDDLSIKAGLDLSYDKFKARLDVVKLGDIYQVKLGNTTLSLTQVEIKEILLELQQIEQLEPSITKLINIIEGNGDFSEVLSKIKLKKIIDTVKLDETGVEALIDTKDFGLEAGVVPIKYVISESSYFEIGETIDFRVSEKEEITLFNENLTGADTVKSLIQALKGFSNKEINLSVSQLELTEDISLSANIYANLELMKAHGTIDLVYKDELVTIDVYLYENAVGFKVNNVEYKFDLVDKDKLLELVENYVDLPETNIEGPIDIGLIIENIIEDEGNIFINLDLSQFNISKPLTISSTEGIVNVKYDQVEALVQNTYVDKEINLETFELLNDKLDLIEHLVEVLKTKRGAEISLTYIKDKLEATISAKALYGDSLEAYAKGEILYADLIKVPVELGFEENNLLVNLDSVHLRSTLEELKQFIAELKGETQEVNINDIITLLENLELSPTSLKFTYNEYELTYDMETPDVLLVSNENLNGEVILVETTNIEKVVLDEEKVLGINTVKSLINSLEAYEAKQFIISIENAEVSESTKLSAKVNLDLEAKKGYGTIDITYKDELISAEVYYINNEVGIKLNNHLYKLDLVDKDRVIGLIKANADIPELEKPINPLDYITGVTDINEKINIGLDLNSLNIETPISVSLESSHITLTYEEIEASVDPGYIEKEFSLDEYISINDKLDLIEHLVEVLKTKRAGIIEGTYRSEKLEADIAGGILYDDINKDVSARVSVEATYDGKYIIPVIVGLKEKQFNVVADPIEASLSLNDIKELISAFSDKGPDSISINEIIDMLVVSDFNSDTIKLNVKGYDITYSMLLANIVTISNNELDVNILLEDTTTIEEVSVVEPLLKDDILRIKESVENVINLAKNPNHTYEIAGGVSGKYDISGSISLTTVENTLVANLYVTIEDILENKTHQLGIVATETHSYITYNSMKLYAERETLNAAIAYALRTFGIENALIDYFLAATIQDIENVFVDPNEGPIYILNYIKAIAVSPDSLGVTLNKDELYTDFAAPSDLDITLNDANGIVSAINIAKAYLNEEDELNVDITLANEGALVEAPTDEELVNYIYVERVDKLIESFLLTAALKEYELSGNLNLRILASDALPVDNFNMKIRLDPETYKPSFIVTYTIPNKAITYNEMDVELYSVDDMIYVKKTHYKIISGSVKKVVRSTFTKEEFNDELVEKIIILLNVRLITAGQIRDAVEVSANHEITPDKVLIGYSSPTETQFDIKLDGEELTGNTKFEDIDITANRNEDGYLVNFLLDAVPGRGLELIGEVDLVSLGEEVVLEFPDFTGWDDTFE